MRAHQLDGAEARLLRDRTVWRPARRQHRLHQIGAGKFSPIVSMNGCPNGFRGWNAYPSPKAFSTTKGPTFSSPTAARHPCFFFSAIPPGRPAEGSRLSIGPTSPARNEQRGADVVPGFASIRPGRAAGRSGQQLRPDTPAVYAALPWAGTFGCRCNFHFVPCNDSSRLTALRFNLTPVNRFRSR